MNGTVAPARGAAGIVIVDAADPAKPARVPVYTVVAPEVTLRFSFAQTSVADPFVDPFADCVHFAPGVSVNEDAAAVPVFLIVIDVDTVFPGVIVVLPPNLLMVEHVAAFVETLPPSVLAQVTLPAAFCSCMTSVPLAAVFELFVMEAANPDNVPVSDSDSITAAAIPATRATGAMRKRRAGREDADMMPHLQFRMHPGSVRTA